MTSPRSVVMIGPALEGKGGISSVVSTYRAGGLFERCGVVYVASIRAGGRLAKFGVALQALLRLACLLGARRCALLHLHSASRASFWRKFVYGSLGMAAGKPVVFQLHGGEFERFYREESGAVAQRAVRRFLESCATVVVLTRGGARLVSSIAPAAKVRVIPNPVHMRATPGRKLPVEPATLLFLGRIEEKKGIFDLLDALARLAPKHQGIHLCVAGEGDARGVQRRVAELGLHGRVTLLGWISGVGKARVLERVGMFVLPSYAEVLPMSLLEAMAIALPVVATAVGGVPEVIEDGVDGLLVPPGDREALAGAIDRVLGDPAYAARLGAAARRKVERFYSEHAVLPRFGELYGELGVPVAG